MLSQKKLGYIVTTIAIILLIILILVKIDTDKKDVFLCEAIAHDPNLDMEDCPAHKSPANWLIPISFGVVFLIMGVGIYLIFTSRATKEKKFKEIDVSKLDKDEKKIYQLLKKNDGSIYQSDIVKQTDLSKVKTTRTLDKMEAKKILERKRRGMTNLVVLK